MSAIFKKKFQTMLAVLLDASVSFLELNPKSSSVLKFVSKVPKFT